MELLALGTARLGGAQAEIRELAGQRVGYFRLADEPADGDDAVGRGSIGPDEADSVARLVRLATDTGVPIVGVLAVSGTDVRHGVASLVAWGRIASALVDASGQVPIALAVIGPCAAGPSLLIGIADAVVFTSDATAFVSGPAAVIGMTGETISPSDLGGPNVHAVESGIAAMVAADEDAAMDAIARDPVPPSREQSRARALGHASRRPGARLRGRRARFPQRGLRRSHRHRRGLRSRFLVRDCGRGTRRTPSSVSHASTAIPSVWWRTSRVGWRGRWTSRRPRRRRGSCSFATRSTSPCSPSSTRPASSPVRTSNGAA